MDLDRARQTYIIEARELLDSMEDSLLTLEQQSDPQEAINAMFRAVHTIKGSAGLFGLESIVHFSHAVESVLDRVRGRQVEFGGDLVGLMLEAHDHLAALIANVQTEAPETDETRQKGERILVRLQPFLSGGLAKATQASAQPGTLPAAAGSSERDCWHLSIRFSPDVLRNGLDPLSFIRYLGTMGEIVHLTSILGRLPEREAFDPEECRLGLEIELDTRADRAAIEEVFEFVREGSQIRLIPPHSQVEAYIQLIRELPEEERFLGEILVAGGCITAHELEAALKLQKEEASEGGTVQGRMLGTIFIQENAVAPPVVAAALEKQKKFQERQAQELKVVKVSADKLDHLVDLVGELVIAAASSHAKAGQVGNVALLEATVTVNKLVEEIRDNALSLRMVQIGDTFSRFRRIVRDVSLELGKAIELEIHGADTELDKTIVEKLSDPLMHIVRNSIDHGIEPVELRRARGKPESGTLSLQASHESGSIVIEVSDDGGGLDKERILAKAIERGLVKAGADLSDQEVINLIFEPGFSTAAAVSSLSGRGVGMDVVRRNIDEMRGTIEVETEPGLGTTLRMRLPLTLAIIDGFQVEVAGASYVVPLDVVIECLDLGPFLESEQNHLINLRGEVLPFLRLREVFQIPCEVPTRERVVVIQHGELRTGIVVDRLVGEFQTVIKPLGRLFRNLVGVGGSTILGSGEVALILDVSQLVQLARARGEKARRKDPVQSLKTSLPAAPAQALLLNPTFLP
jgi:two-component system chemotaxis sensor kinase CheA